MTDKVVITDEHTASFRQWVAYWANRYGLNSWELHVDQDEEENADYRAYTTAWTPDRLAVIAIASEWDIEPTDFWLARMALHEVLELLLWEVGDLIADSKKLQKDRAFHIVIQTLINTEFERLYEEACQS